MSVFFVNNSFEAFGSVSVESYLLDGEERSLALRVAEQCSEVVRQRISSFACLDGGSRVMISTFNKKVSLVKPQISGQLVATTSLQSQSDD